MTFLQHPRTVHIFQNHPALLAAGLACVVAALWAMIESIGGLIPARYSPYQTVWMRYGVHLLFLILVWGPRRRGSLIRTPRWKAQILRGLLMVGMPILFILAAFSMDVHFIWSIFWIAPLVSMIGAALLFKEKISPAQWTAALLGMAGTLAILRPSYSGGWTQALMTLGMSLCFIFYMLATRLLVGEDTLTSLFFTAFAVFLPLSFVMPALWRPLTLKAAAGMALIGLSGFGLLFALDRALELAPVALVAPFLYSEPIWYLLASKVLHPSPFHILDLAGLLLILIPGSVLFYLMSHHSKSAVVSLTGQFRT